LLGGVLMSLARYEGGGTEQVILAQTGGHVTVGAWHPATIPDSISARMWTSGQPQRIDDFADVPGMLQVVTGNVRACVAVPVVVNGRLWGSLAAASRTGPLPLGTEDRLTVFAEIVAAAVVSAAARTSLRVLADEQAALLRVAALVAEGATEGAIFNAVAVEAASLIDDEPTTLSRYEGQRTFTVLATRNGPVGPGTRYTVPVDDAGTSAEMLRTGRPARQDRYDTIADHSFGYQQFGLGSSVSVPIMVQGRLWGALGCLNEGRRLPAETEGRLVKFSELVGSALANVEARAELERFGDEQAALRRVAELTASGVPYASVLRTIVTSAARLSDGAVVTIGQYEPSGTWRRVEVGTSPDGEAEPSSATPAEEAVAHEVLVTGRPVAVHDDPSASGPLDHRRLLWGCGVPVRVEEETWGALVATAGRRPLPSGSEDRLVQFAHLAATAVAATRSRDTLNRLAREQAALRRVAELIARGAPLGEVFDAVANEASNILRGMAVGLFRYDPDGFATIVAQCHSPNPVGLRIRRDAMGVRESGGAVRFDTLVGTGYARLAQEFEVEAMVAVPIAVEGQIWGGLATTTTAEEPLSDGTEERLREFAELASAAVANAENKAQLRASRARLVVMADETRQRLQRDVHDGAQQRLVQTVLTLKLGLDLAARGEDPVELMKEALDNAERATVELRDLVHGILPASLSRGGLRTGIESLVAGLTVPVEVDVSALPEQRLPADLEVTAYFIVAEALTNVVKHAGATRTRVSVAAEADVLTIEVTDDGCGGADLHGSGLTGLGDRVDALNGSLLLASPRGGGTTVRVTLPCAGV
jgi:signal transduction histidine kinase